MLHVVNEHNFAIKLHTTTACAYMLYVKQWSLTEVRPWLPWWCLHFPCNTLHPLTSLGWSQFSCASSRWTNPQWWFHWWVPVIPAGRHAQRKKGREGRREWEERRQREMKQCVSMLTSALLHLAVIEWVHHSILYNYWVGSFPGSSLPRWNEVRREPRNGATSNNML